MKIDSLAVKNYRALRDVEIPVSHFVCLTGENNAGKSSFLQSLALFKSGTTLAKTNFFDPTEDIFIALSFDGVGEDALSKLATEHRIKIEPLVQDGKLTLVRRWGAIDGKSQLGYYGLVPKDERFHPDFVDKLVAKKKAGIAFRAEVIGHFPELEGTVTNTSNQTAVKAAIKTLEDMVPAEEREERFVVIPTGSGFSVSPMLPEIIYIPAVKDLRDETKTAETSQFGKILSIVMDWIEPQLGDAKKLFHDLTKQLTRLRNDQGEIEDHRLPDIRRIEDRMQQLLQESFATVSLELDIPPPSIKSVLSTAQLFADDGIKGPLDLKGDGLRRAVVFAILRTYVEFVAEQEYREAKKAAKQEVEAAAGAQVEAAPANGEEELIKPKLPSYLLLFEEPELFLHPDAQRILFDALRIFSEKHHVVVTTHSPLFLGPGATATFVRLSKTTADGIPKPFTVAKPVNITLGAKDAFQVICFENNNAAFFSRRVVLVEGDSDVIVFPHVARLLNADWQCSKHSVAFARIQGKGNIRRYRSFFETFGVRVFVIGDLDILNEGFEHLDPDEATKALHQALNNEISRVIAAAGPPPAPNGKAVKEAHSKTSLRELWEKVREARTVAEKDTALFPQLEAAVAEFFAWEQKYQRREVLQKADDAGVAAAKAKLLAALRSKGIFILEKGDIESYYPEAVIGGDKPSKAQSFCSVVTTRETAIACCREITCPETAATKPEFEFILGPIFEVS